MYSSVIPSVLSYPTMQLPLQPAHHRHVLFNPLVLEYDPLFYVKHQIGTELSHDVLNPTHVSF